ncbi:MAG: hypothetical protein C0523_10490 [Cytophaga sp.]|nr:hypothetical protein [Cytophaga sp.]
MKKIITTVFFMWKLAAVLIAQQDPIHAQYLFNPLVINPAYAGINNNLCASVAYRKQWTGLEGQPQTMLANGHVSVAENKVGLGAVLSHDETGVSSNVEMNMTFSYKLNLGNNNVLSFGLQGGVMQFKNEYAALHPYSADDPAFTGAERFTRINIGAGLIYKSDRFMAGLSVPRMLPSGSTAGAQKYQVYNQHLYAFGAYVWQFSERVYLKPSVLVRMVEGARPSADIASSFTIDQKYTAGLFTRNFKTYGVLGQAMLLKKLVVGYAFEIPLGNAIETTYTTHEILVGLRLSALHFHDTYSDRF